MIVSYGGMVISVARPTVNLAVSFVLHIVLPLVNRDIGPGRVVGAFVVLFVFPNIYLGLILIEFRKIADLLVNVLFGSYLFLGRTVITILFEVLRFIKVQVHLLYYLLINLNVVYFLGNLVLLYHSELPLAAGHIYGVALVAARLTKRESIAPPLSPTPSTPLMLKEPAFIPLPPPPLPPPGVAPLPPVTGRQPRNDPSALTQTHLRIFNTRRVKTRAKPRNTNYFDKNRHKIKEIQQRTAKCAVELQEQAAPAPTIPQQPSPEQSLAQCEAIAEPQVPQPCPEEPDGSALE